MSAAYDLYQQGRSHLRSGMPAQATVALEKAKRLEPEKASIREALGIAYFRIMRWEEAEAEFRKAGAPQPGSARRGGDPPEARPLASAATARRGARARRRRALDRPQRSGSSRSATRDA